MTSTSKLTIFDITAAPSHDLLPLKVPFFATFSFSREPTSVLFIVHAYLLSEYALGVSQLAFSLSAPETQCRKYRFKLGVYSRVQVHGTVTSHGRLLINSRLGVMSILKNQIRSELRGVALSGQALQQSSQFIELSLQTQINPGFSKLA